MELLAIFMVLGAILLGISLFIFFGALLMIFIGGLANTKGDINDTTL